MFFPRSKVVFWSICAIIHSWVGQILMERFRIVRIYMMDGSVGNELAAPSVKQGQGSDQGVYIVSQISFFTPFAEKIQPKILLLSHIYSKFYRCLGGGGFVNLNFMN